MTINVSVEQSVSISDRLNRVMLRAEQAAKDGERVQRLLEHEGPLVARVFAAGTFERVSTIVEGDDAAYRELLRKSIPKTEEKLRRAEAIIDKLLATMVSAAGELEALFP